MTTHDWLDEYLLNKAGVTKDFKVEWEWWRYQVGGKMFAATMQPEPKYKEYAGLTLLTLKCDPAWAEQLRVEYPSSVLPGFYTDKRNWNSINLDGDLPEELLRELCDHSYDLVFAKLTKKLQREISAE